MRQTTLTTRELKDKLVQRDPKFPRCLCINELGELARVGDAESVDALVPFLDPDEEEPVRALAYVNLLSVMRPLPPNAATALREFADQTMNAGITRWAARLYGLGLPVA